MPRNYSNDRRDKNEWKLIRKMQSLEYAGPGERCSLSFIKLRPGQGCDLVVSTPRWTEHVEIKNPDERWELTPDEERLKGELESIGRRLWVLETERDVVSMWEMLG